MNGRRSATALIVAVGLFVLTAGGLLAADPVMPEITGAVWMKSSQQEKLAFLVGASSVVAIEHHIDLKEADDPSKFTEGWVAAFKDKKWAEIVDKIDAYFAANPDKGDKLVMDVVWKELILPTMVAKGAKP
ncbi:hypothetical protein [Desulfolutivibrio sp.]|uniref:hypothetical protein n=1 Tax=Desulfolutivibrio sp. TaxID=2773296 RepID=UPI002F966D51